ncbi:Art7 [Symbiodinium sp. CCMP2456]|nr:Art7 [Symbiodinium sp. CCMP2456]
MSAAWLRVADACAEGCGDALQVATALEQLEASNALWRELRDETWERLRVADAQLRSFSMDEIARVRSCGESSPLTALAVDLLRPPWLQMPQRVADAVHRFEQNKAPEPPDAKCRKRSADATEVLCTVDCHPDMDDRDLCWHCWHRDECNGRPDEIQELLAAARRLGAGAALGHRARLAEQRWEYPGRLASALLALLARGRHDKGKAQVLVLGGLGVSAVAAARCGASVQVVEPNPTARSALCNVFRANKVTELVTVIPDVAASSSFDICAVEGLEPDGLLGCGVLAVLQQLQPKLAEAQVLPSSLHLEVALAASRLATAAGIAEGAILESFAESHGGLAPVPLALQQSAAALRPVQLSEFSPAWTFQSEATTSATKSSIRLRLLKEAQADSLLLRFHVSFGELGEGWTGQSVQQLPARLEKLPSGSEVAVTTCCNLQRLWFEVPDLKLYSSPPLPRVFLLDWYAEMMNDVPRNTAFEAAIRKVVAAARQPSGACRVIDLGCGAGVLSMLALRAGATEVLGVDHSPHLARCARRVLAQEDKVSVLCGDIRTVSVAEEDRFDVVVAELLDAGGLGEKIIPFLRHAKSRLLRPGGYLVPRGLRVRASLVEARLPQVTPRLPGGGIAAEVDLSAFDPFWLPARAERSEWLGIDLDAGCDWEPASEVVEVIWLNFQGSQADLIEALQERELQFPLSGARRINAVAWWFEADLGIGDEGACDLTSAPSRFRPAHCGATHWVQALAGIGPYEAPDGASALGVRVRTDGVTFTWTPVGFDAALRPVLPEAPEESSDVAAWRSEVAEASRQLQDLENSLDRIGDVARLQALQAAALALAAQPGMIGLEATPDVVARLLKGLFV